MVNVNNILAFFTALIVLLVVHKIENGLDIKNLTSKDSTHLDKMIELYNYRNLNDSQIQNDEKPKILLKKDYEKITQKKEELEMSKLPEFKIKQERQLSGIISAAEEAEKFKDLPRKPKNTVPIPPCGQKTFGHDFPMTAIHSFMGAGNTWLRHLIETATGFYTGSAFRDSSLYKGGFKGEFQEVSSYGKVIGIKVHNPFDAKGERQTYELIKKQSWTKCVILLRNPFDTFKAEFNRYVSKGHTATAAMDVQRFAKVFQSNPEVNSWMGIGKGGRPMNKRWVFSYKKSYEFCTTGDGSEAGKYPGNHTAHIVYYEDLKKNPVNEIRKIAEYLDAYDEERFQKCVIDDVNFSEGSFHRKKHLEVDPFSEKQRFETEESVRILNFTGLFIPESYLDFEKE